MIWKWNFWRFRIGVGIHFVGKKDVYGYTNRCDDGKFIVFLDYDDLPFNWVLNEVKALQKDFGLGNFYFFKSSKDSYHVVCFSKVCNAMLMDILYNSSIDENYYKIPYKIGKRLLTLRLTKKGEKEIKFVLCLRNESDRFESGEHKRFFNNLFGDIIRQEDLEYNNDLEHPTKIICSHYNVK